MTSSSLLYPSPATAHTRELSLMTFIWDVAFIASIIILVREGVRKMSSPKPPSIFFMGASPQTTTAWGSYYHGSHEQLIGISRTTFLRCRKRQQVREYDQRRVVEASWTHLLRPASWGRSKGGREEGEERNTAVRFAEVVEYIPPTPVGSNEKQRQPCHPCRSELEKPAVGGEEARKGADQDGAIAKALEITDEDTLDEIVDKIWKGLHP
ncbi:hypothetical protein LZ31DRAFT_543827 [Colletotrichum somersetense]|nr:hypothetical protein LZ31DRAFT_543827 [Colletotrichum somersetense]